MAAAGHVRAKAPTVAGSVAGVAVHGGTVTTTFHHPFYDQTQAVFTDAEYLHAGDVLQTPAGTAQVTGVRLFHANTTTYDLTIDGLHTYYVVAGDTPVLVHNINSACPTGSQVGINSGGLSSKAFDYRMKTIGLKLRNVAVATVQGRDEPVYGLSNGEDFHSEDHILSQLNPGEKITELYSERQPCPRCVGRLAGFLKDWSRPTGSRDASTRTAMLNSYILRSR
jgi:hypothetical protein